MSLQNTLAELAVKLSANIEDFKSDLDRAVKISNSTSARISDDFDKISKKVSAGFVAAKAALVGITVQTTNTAANFHNLSTNIGVSTEFLTEYRLISDLAGSSVEDLAKDIKNMSQSVLEADNGIGTSKESFDKLNISLDTLKSLNPEQQFNLIREKTSELASQSEKASVSMNIFGRAGSDLLTILNQDEKAIEEVRKKAIAMGLSMSQEAAAGAAGFKEQLKDLKTTMKGIFESIGLQLIPAFSEIITQLSSEKISDGNRKWQGLQTTLASLYGGVLLVKSAFEILGKAMGNMAVKAAQVFKATGNLVEAFVKRVERGALIIASAFSDSAAQAEAKLGAEIAKLERQAASLFTKFGEGAVDRELFKDVEKILADVFKNIEKVKKASSGAGKTFKSEYVPPIISATKETAKLDKQIEKLKNQLNNDFFDIVESLKTPLEKLKTEYENQVEIITKYIALNADNLLIVSGAVDVYKKLTSEYKKNKTALESQLTPYQSLIQGLEQEINLLQQRTPLTARQIAMQELANIEITEASVGADEYNKKLAEMIELLEMAASHTGTFGDGINTIGELLNKAFSGGNFFADLSKGFKAMTRDAQSFADGLGSIESFASSISDIWQSTAGQDDSGRVLDSISQIASSGALGPVAQGIAQVANIVNSLTGGRLFGTSYSVQSTTRSFDIGSQGASGLTSTLETRRRSLFRGTSRRTTETELDAQTQAAIDQLFENLQSALAAAASSVGATVGDIVTGTFVEQFDKDGNLLSQISTVNGRDFVETFADFEDRLTGENLLAGITSIFPEIQALAEPFRNEANSLLEFSQFAVNAASDLVNDRGLTSSIQGALTLVNEYTQANESLSETYERLKTATVLLENAFDLIGADIGLMRDEFVRFAADISEAAGGTQEAARLWQSYFDTFYTNEEILSSQLASATSNRDQLLDSLGLGNVTPEEFRQLFEEALPNLSGEMVAEWLRAADAIGVVIDLENDLNQIYEEQAAEIARLQEELNSFMNDINTQLANFDLSEFAQGIRDISEAYQFNVQQARRLGATENQLLAIRRLAERQQQALIRNLEQDITTALADLYGTQLDAVNTQISVLQEQNQLIEQTRLANLQRYQQELAQIENIHSFARNLLLDETLSPLNPQEQLSEAQNLFNELFALAQQGDLNALNQLPNVAQQLLSFGREVFASSPAFTALFNQVTGMLNSLDAGTPPQIQQIEQGAQMINLLEEQKRLQMEANALQRLQAAQSIAQNIGEIISVTGESFEEYAARVNLPIEAFLTDLGLSNDELIDYLDQFDATAAADANMTALTALDQNTIQIREAIVSGNQTQSADIQNLTSSVERLESTQSEQNDVLRTLLETVIAA